MTRNLIDAAPPRVRWRTRPTQPCRLRDLARACGVAALAALATPALAGEPPPGFARLSDIAPGVAQEMRYAGSNNFTGAPVPGYRAAQCWLRRRSGAGARGGASRSARQRLRSCRLRLLSPQARGRRFRRLVKKRRRKDQARLLPQCRKARAFRSRLYRGKIRPFDRAGGRSRREGLGLWNAVRFFRQALLDRRAKARRGAAQPREARRADAAPWLRQLPARMVALHASRREKCRKPRCRDRVSGGIALARSKRMILIQPVFR